MSTLSGSVGAGTRTEHDLLGELPVPADAYYGIHTQRAVANFPISGVAMSSYGELVSALASIKAAAAMANHQLGLLDGPRSGAIVAAAREIADGRLHDQFAVDVMQGGAGTSSNMAANEVIANRALEILGFERGDYAQLHPLDHVNLGQSTNDVYPTALRVALHRMLAGLLAALARLRAAVSERADAFAAVPKLGRTQLQDAVPMTLGREFASWGTTLGEEEQRIREVSVLLCEVNLGGTAIGTSVNTHPSYPKLACQLLADETGVPVVLAEDLVEATSDTGVFVAVSGTVKRTALKLSKIASDLRLLASGPTAGFGEINLPAVQGGSSIMPGKVNPVIPEAINQIAFEVVGADVTVSMAAQAGQLQLNAFEPVIAVALFRSIRQLTAGCDLLADRCVRGVTANADVLRRQSAAATGLLTVLARRLGYEAANRLRSEARDLGVGIEELVVSRGILTPSALDDVIDAMIRQSESEGGVREP
jgi:aspartate ammonia-lyase